MKTSYFICGVAILCCIAFAHSALADASATILGLYPAAEVPINARVTFTVGTQGFTNPTFYLVDSFPGGATTVNIDSSGNFSWTPNTDEVGTHNLTITVSDSQGDSATASQEITVDGAPTVTIGALSPGASVAAGVPVSFSVSASGLFNPVYSVADSFPYSSMRSYALSPDGTFQWTPVAQDIGTHVITVSAQDSYGNTASASTTLVVLSAFGSTTPPAEAAPAQVQQPVATETPEAPQISQAQPAQTISSATPPAAAPSEKTTAPAAPRPPASQAPQTMQTFATATTTTAQPAPAMPDIPTDNTPIPAPAPVESIGGFILSGIAHLFSSLLRLW